MDIKDVSNSMEANVEQINHMAEYKMLQLMYRAFYGCYWRLNVDNGENLSGHEIQMEDKKQYRIPKTSKSGYCQVWLPILS